MEFKGTKGKWIVGNGEVYRPASSGSISPYWRQICVIVNNGTDEYKANALLISKAPLLLDMLNEICPILERYNEKEKHQKVLQLIKEATTI